MGRKPAPVPILRKTIALPETLWDEVSAHRFDNRIASEAEAVRQVLQAGLKGSAPHNESQGVESDRPCPSFVNSKSGICHPHRRAASELTGRAGRPAPAPSAEGVSGRRRPKDTSFARSSFSETVVRGVHRPAFAGMWTLPEDLIFGAHNQNRPASRQRVA